MIRVRAQIDPELDEASKRILEVASEGDGYVRAPERGDDLEAGRLQVRDGENTEEREPFQMVGRQVIDLRVIPGVIPREPVAAPVWEASEKILGLIAAGLGIKVVTAHNDPGVTRDGSTPDPRTAKRGGFRHRSIPAGTFGHRLSGTSEQVVEVCGGVTIGSLGDVGIEL
jgi:hypothetical protein